MTTRAEKITQAVDTMKAYDAGIAYPSVLTACAVAVVAAGWRPPARIIRTVEELNGCNDFATLRWVDDAGLPHAHIAVTMKEHARQLDKLFGEPMWPMTVIHEGDDL